MPGSKGCLGICVVVGLLTLAGCAAGPGASGSREPVASAAAVGTRTSAMTLTITTTATDDLPTAGAPPPTSEPASAAGECPYLSAEAVADINGQRTGGTQTIAVEPHPVCVFSRSDGSWLATVRVIEAATPEQAAAAVDMHVPVDRSSPANHPAGWTGGSMVTDEGSTYAVAKGTIAVVARSNQHQTIKGRQMVIATVQNLRL